MTTDSDALADFGATFTAFMREVVRQAPPPDDPVFRRRLTDHFGQAPDDLPIVTANFGSPDHANLHLALASFLENAEKYEVLGAIPPHEYMPLNLASLAAKERHYGEAVVPGPVEYVNLPVGQSELLSAVQTALYLIEGESHRLAVLFQGPKQELSRRISLQVMGEEKAHIEAFMAWIRQEIRRRNVYRGHIISLSLDNVRQVQVDFHQLPPISREDIVLPDGLLSRVERHTICFAHHRDRLLAAGRHLKRGLLLYGPPGTGKTLTAMYLAGQMTDRTVLLLTGGGLGLVEESCRMARLLEPATVILEDVDLVATLRDRQSTGCNAILFELLNQMDGLADDADVLFLLTTNRPDILEPALAARPGRIDLAVEIPLPDARCRRRLISLYAEGLDLELDRPDQYVERIKGVSAAFIRELLRRAALVAADEADGPISVTDRHVDLALHELLVEGGELTQSLLGASKPSG